MSTIEREVTLDGLNISLGKPRVIAETTVGRCWYADLLRFSTGELMLTYSLNPDENDNEHNSQAVCVSNDGGRTFDFAYDVNGFHNSGGEARLALPDGRIVGPSCRPRSEPRGQSRRFVAHHWTFDKGGRRYEVEPWAVVIDGLPGDVTPYTFPQTRSPFYGFINWFGDIVPLENGQLISTVSLQFAGDNLATTVAVVSEDQGRNWRYLSTIAEPKDVPDAREGPDEPCLIQLADGDLMCISRVGSLEDQKLARSYSSDQGRTWSPVERLPAYSVAPQILRLKNEVLVLSTGRPGLSLWFSMDRRGESWQSFDILDYHNSVMDASSQITPRHDASRKGLSQVKEAQTTAYTAMVEVSDNRVFLVYDRLPCGWDPVPADSGERSQIYLLEFSIA